MSQSEKHIIPDELLEIGDHLEALRQVLLKGLFAVCFFFAVSVFFYSPLLDYATKPYENHFAGVQKGRPRELTLYSFKNETSAPISFIFPEKALQVSNEKTVILEPGRRAFWHEEKAPPKLALFGPLEGFAIALKICFFASLLASSPFWIYFIFEFITPALLPDEKKLAALAFASAFFSAGLGLFLAFGVILPLANAFFWSFNQTIGQNIWSLEHYLDYTFLLSLGTAVAIELGAILFFAVHFGWIGPEFLKKNRKAAVVMALILGALLTPPDIMTQLFIAVPMILLYEFCIFYSRLKTLPSCEV